jgi:transcriptional regulator GlxA family with amidase domain
MLRQSFADSGRTAQIANAIRWIRSHFDEPFSSETLAETAHMSTRRLTVIFPLSTL